MPISRNEAQVGRKDLPVTVHFNGLLSAYNELTDRCIVLDSDGHRVTDVPRSAVERLSGSRRGSAIPEGVLQLVRGWSDVSEALRKIAGLE